MDFKAILSKLESKKSLEGIEMTAAMEAIMSGSVADTEIEIFLSRLREKGETAREIHAAAEVMRRRASHLSKKYPEALDTCGTGGDGASTLNISTLASLAASAAGVRVAKHGNRSVSSQCGSADLLEKLGVPVESEPEVLERTLVQNNFAFFFAPRFHPATRFAMPARKRIKGKTIFNLLGPLSNPAGAATQLVGVYGSRWVPVLAQVLSDLGARRALVVHGEDGLDEMTLCGRTQIAELVDGKIRRYTTRPEEFGLKRADPKSLRCDSLEESVKAAIEVLEGAEGPKTDVVCLNAGAALYAAGKTPSIKEGFRLARSLFLDGCVKKKLDEIRSYGNISSKNIAS